MPAKTFTQKIIERDPLCVLCGGTRASQTIEHMPSRILFREKLRPMGLEVGACKECQNSTRKQELVIALLVRLYPDPIDDVQKASLAKIMGSAYRNNPGLMEEMRADQLPILFSLGAKAFDLPSWDFFTTDGPICHSALLEFGYKMGAVLHYHLMGAVLPAGGAVFVRQYTNTAAFTEPAPIVLTVLGAPASLQMGMWHVSDQFRYSSAKGVDGDFTGHIAVFGEAFALELHCVTDAAMFSAVPGAFVRKVHAG